MLLAEIYLIICLLFLAGKDATSYLLKRNITPDSLTGKRVKRWHRDGVVLYGLYLLPFLYILYTKEEYWEIGEISLYALLIRLALFDLAFNYWASLDMSYLGSTAGFDRFWVKIFGQRGAVKKSLFFLAVLIGLNILLK